jgi:hypothetical protein
MTEKDLNRILNKSSKDDSGWGYKIVDATADEVRSGRAVERPFDDIGFRHDFDYAFEAKFLKGYQAFSFDMIKEHQIFHLNDIKTRLGKRPFPIYTVFPLGIWESRKFFDVIFFDVSFIQERIARGDKSVKKKELLEIKASGKFLEIKSEYINLSLMPEVILYGSNC